MQELEEWRRVADFPDYSVSSFGRVRRETPGKRHSSVFVGQIISSWLNEGYPMVTLHEGRSKRSIYVYVLVCEAFHGLRPTPKHGVAHWDGERLNTKSDNLRWATQVENMADAIRHGRTTRGEKCRTAKLTAEKVVEIRRRLALGEDQSSIARDFGISRTTVSEINTGRKWRWLLGSLTARPSTRPRKLHETDVVKIRQLLAAGATNKSIAAEFEVAPNTISGIKHHRFWKTDQ